MGKWALLLIGISLLALVVTRCSRARKSEGRPTEGTGAAESPARGKVKVGDIAPDFALASQTGQIVRLSDFKGKKSVVLYFYPKDETPGCTAEACAFRDRYEVFQKAGAEVIGVSSDSVDSHKKFAANHNLPFILLSDTGGKLRQRYGVPTTLGLMPGRVTYVIDKKGGVRLLFSSQMNATQHVEEALKILKAYPETPPV